MSGDAEIACDTLQETRIKYKYFVSKRNDGPARPEHVDNDHDRLLYIRKALIKAGSKYHCCHYPNYITHHYSLYYLSLPFFSTMNYMPRRKVSKRLQNR